MSQKPNKFYPYKGQEFHLNIAANNHTHQDPEKMELSSKHFEASGLWMQAIQEDDHHLRKMKIKKYKKYCADHKIEEFTLINEGDENQ